MPSRDASCKGKKCRCDGVTLAGLGNHFRSLRGVSVPPARHATRFLCAIPHIGEVVATTRGGKVMRANNPKGVYTCKCGREIEVYLRCVSVVCNLHGEMKRVESGESSKDCDAHCEANI